MCFYHGRHWKIEYACRSNGRKPAEKLWKKLSKKNLAIFIALIKRIADTQKIYHPNSFKKLRGKDDIWQIRSGDYRLLCYKWKNTHIILTNGFKKDQTITDTTEIQRAIKIKSEDLLQRER